MLLLWAKDWCSEWFSGVGKHAFYHLLVEGLNGVVLQMRTKKPKPIVISGNAQLRHLTDQRPRITDKQEWSHCYQRQMTYCLLILYIQVHVVYSLVEKEEGRETGEVVAIGRKPSLPSECPNMILIDI